MKGIFTSGVLSRLAAQHVKVVLGGDGADELFAGYPAFQAHKVVQNLSVGSIVLNCASAVDSE
jgi:asparagine synthase (glutamine-hydrolysing)